MNDLDGPLRVRVSNCPICFNEAEFIQDLIEQEQMKVRCLNEHCGIELPARHNETPESLINRWDWLGYSAR